MSNAEQRLYQWPSRTALYIAAAAIALFAGFGVFAYQAITDKVDTSTKTQEIAIALARNTECARQVQSDYEEKRDAIFSSADNRTQLLAAIEAFREFKAGPDGLPESRAERTKRLCPDGGL